MGFLLIQVLVVLAQFFLILILRFAVIEIGSIVVAIHGLVVAIHSLVVAVYLLVIAVHFFVVAVHSFVMCLVFQRAGVGDFGSFGGLRQLGQVGSRQFAFSDGAVLSGSGIVAGIDELVVFGSSGVLFGGLGIGLGDLCVHFGNIGRIHHSRCGRAGGGNLFHGSHRELLFRGHGELGGLGLVGQGHGHSHGHCKGAARSGQGLCVIHFLILLSHNFNLL